MIGEILSSNFVLLIIVPAVIAFAILWLCKYYDVSLIPKSFKKGGKHNFKLPKLDRKKDGNSGKYNWTVDDEDESDEEESHDDRHDDEYIEVKRSHSSGRNMYD
jgi:hypothetical protein